MTASPTPTVSAPRVSADDAQGASGVPRPVSPLDGALVDASAPTFVWHEVPGAVGYTLQVASDPTFAAPLHALAAGPATELTLVSTLPVSDDELFWRVRADLPNGSGAYSGYGRFTAAADAAVDAYRAQHEAEKATKAREIAKARATYLAESDLVPPYERPESTTSAAMLTTMAFLLLSFLLVIGVIMAIMSGGV